MWPDQALQGWDVLFPTFASAPVSPEIPDLELLTTAAARSVPVLPHLSSRPLGCGCSAPPCPQAQDTRLPVFSGHHQGTEKCPAWFPPCSNRGTKSLPRSPVNLPGMRSRPSRNKSGVSGGWEDVRPSSLVRVEAMCQGPVPSWNLVFSGASQWISTGTVAEDLQALRNASVGQQGGDGSRMIRWERVKKRLCGVN